MIEVQKAIYRAAMQMFGTTVFAVLGIAMCATGAQAQVSLFPNL